MKRKTWILKSLVLSAFLSLNSFATASDSIAYYSDNQNDRVVAFGHFGCRYNKQLNQML